MTRRAGRPAMRERIGTSRGAMAAVAAMVVAGDAASVQQRLAGRGRRSSGLVSPGEAQFVVPEEVSLLAPEYSMGHGGEHRSAESASRRKSEASENLSCAAGQPQRLTARARAPLLGLPFSEPRRCAGPKKKKPRVAASTSRIRCAAVAHGFFFSDRGSGPAWFGRRGSTGKLEAVGQSLPPGRACYAMLGFQARQTPRQADVRGGASRPSPSSDDDGVGITFSLRPCCRSERTAQAARVASCGPWARAPVESCTVDCPETGHAPSSDEGDWRGEHGLFCPPAGCKRQVG